MRLYRHVESGCPATKAAERWATRRLGGVRHERQVATIATNLFDLTKPLHGLGAAARRLLRLGAMVHDVGRCVSKQEHPAEGAWMILADKTLPLTPAERRALAYLTLYHRDAVPPAGHDAVLHRDDDAAGLLRLLALLRTADALDSRSLEPARMVFALAAGRVLRATCHLAADCPDARRVYTRRKKFRLLNEVLGVRVEVEIEPAGSLRLAA